MKVYTSGSSPFGRKVKIAAAVKDLSSAIAFEYVDTLPVRNPGLQSVNPLAKIPVLVTDAGEHIFDSGVICEYLDSMGPGTAVLFPRDGDARWRTLTLGSLADGILEAALLLVYEKRFRPEDKWVDSWMERQQAKIDAALDHLEADPPALLSNGPDYGQLTVAVALGYLDFRHGGVWRDGHPRLVAWLDAFADRVPAYGATQPE